MVHYSIQNQDTNMILDELYDLLVDIFIGGTNDEENNEHSLSEMQ